MNTWKRAFALLLCLCITLSMVPAPAGAVEGAAITVSSTEVYPGNYAYLYINAQNLENLASLDLEIYYDSQAMLLHDHWTGELFSDSVVSVNANTQGVIRLSAASFSGMSGSGGLLTLVFEIKDDCPAGDYPIALAVGEAYDISLQHVHLSGSTGNIRVLEWSSSGPTGDPFYMYTSASDNYLNQGEQTSIWLYNSWSHHFASATFTAEYDSELFELVSVNLGSGLTVEGAIYSINDRIPGLVQVVYANPTGVSAYELVTLTLRSKVNTEGSAPVTFKVSDAYDVDLIPFGDYEATEWLYLQESQVAEDLPDLFLDTEQLIVGQQSNATLSLQADAPVAAGDFLLSYDPSVIRCVSVTASADVAANGGMIVINPFYTEGKIRFSYLNESGYDGGLELIQIVWEPVSSPDLHYCVTMSGTAVVDVHYNPVELDYVTETDCIYGVFNYDPTCTEPGQLDYRCMDCLDGWYVEQDPALGHDHVASVIAPTCTEQGCDAHICSRCGDAYYENYTDALGHDFGEWYSYVASGCNYVGEERRDCSRCDAYESRELPLAEHTWCEWYVTMWPNCMESGWEERYCTECYIYEYREMPITDHAWCEWYVSTTPTCMNSGTEARYCTYCYAYEYRELPMTDHTWCEWYVTMWPTCTESGWEERYCDWCYTYESRELPALGHNYYEYVWEPSCEFDGYTEHYCENCGSSYYDNYTDALGHNWGEWTLNQEPNCMESGWEERYCDRCGEYDYQELPVTDHTWCEWYVSTIPTCMNSGTEARYCTWCYTYEYRELPMTDHNYLEYVTEPGCEFGGYTEYCCEYCGDSYYDNYTDAVGHNWGEWTLNQEPNCMESGWEERHCDRCGEYEYQELPMTDHTWCEWYVSTTPTCMNSGTEERYCIWCYTYEYRELPTTDHNYLEYVTEPSCEFGGYTEHCCEYCGDSYYDNYTDAVGHNWGEWTLNQEPNCMESGWEERYCDRCGEYDYQELPMTDHTWCEWYVSTTPTCMNSGTEERYCIWCYTYEYRELPMTDHNYLEYVTEPGCEFGGYTEHCCEYCGDSYYDNYTDALGHGYGEWYAVTVTTCTEDGEYRRDCGRCEHYETMVMPAYGHNYESVVTEATCTMGGYTTHTCGNCGHSYVNSYTEALGHAYGEWYGISAATCIAAGMERRDCQRCEHYEEREIPALAHSYSDAVRMEPTCTEPGTLTYTCTACGGSYTEEIPALGHDWHAADCDSPRTCARCGLTDGEVLGHTYGEWYPLVEATCTEDGEYRRDCGRCEHYETMVMPAYGHNYGSVVTEPTCTMGGYTTHTCGNCGHSYVNSYTEALGHDYGDWYALTEATCTQNGQYRRDCGRCGHYEIMAMPAYGHYYETTVLEATCTMGGYTTHICANCGHSYVDAYTEALGHAYGEWYAVTVTTCTEDGEYRRDCGRCEHYETMVMPAYGHNYESVVTEATCTMGGYTTHTCGNCGHSYVNSYTEALGHAYGEWYGISAATCIAAGMERRDCQRCDHYEEREIPTLAHSYSDAVRTEPTCTEPGTLTYTCTACGGTYTEEIPALGHDWHAADCDSPRTCARCGLTDGEVLGHTYGEWYPLVEATCTEEGQDRRDCIRCDAHELKDIPAKGHSYVDVVTAPSCTVGGYTTHTCADCGDSYVDTYTEPMGHGYGEWYAVTVTTCTEDGEYRRDCGRCEHYETMVMPAYGHNYESVVTEPTCTMGGYTTHTCGNCGHSYVNSYTESLGHAYGEWYGISAATCIAAGMERRDCQRCDHYEEREIPALAHSYSDAVRTEPTCTEPGTLTYTCTACGGSYTEEIPALGHDWHAADCDSPRTCARCGLTDGEVLGHTYGEWYVVTAASCTESGLEQHDCIRCGHSETREISVLDHSFGRWYVVTAASCTEAGVEQRDCIYCGTAETREIPALGHDWHAADCDSPRTCGRCGLTDGEILGHEYGEWFVVEEATCTEPGRELRECIRCDAHETREVAPIGHNYESVVTEATCVAGGYTTHTCTNCGHSYIDGETEINPENHVGQEGTECECGVFLGGSAVPDGWLEDNGLWYYYREGQKVTGWLQLGSIWYFMDADGVMQTGWLLDGGVWYYLNNHMMTGWQQIGGAWYYFGANGAMQSGWLLDGGVWYYLNNHMMTGWQQIGGAWYYFDANGAMQSGWLLDGGVWYYLNNHMQTGWQQIDGVWYYFDGNGAMQSGWLWNGGVWYYLGNYMATGWQQIGGAWYYFDANGAMQSGWLLDGGVWYYLNNHMQTGWQQIGGAWYYFSGNGAMQSGWLWNGGVWYYLNNHMQTGWQQIGGVWYYFNANGAMQSGWQQIGGKWYYLNNHMITGWLQLGGVWYYLDPTGAMVTGSYVIDGVTYYFDESGVWIP